MRKSLVILVILLMVSACTACTKNTVEKNTTFTGIINEVEDQSILVETTDDVGFDLASVNLSEIMDIGFTLQVGQSVQLTILPEIRESYPVQVTAIDIESLSDNVASDAVYQKNNCRRCESYY